MRGLCRVSWVNDRRAMLAFVWGGALRDAQKNQQQQQQQGAHPYPYYTHIHSQQHTLFTRCHHPHCLGARDWWCLLHLQGSTVVEQALEVDGRKWAMTCVSMGNPHAITYSVDGQPIKVRCFGGQGWGKRAGEPCCGPQMLSCCNTAAGVVEGQRGSS